MRIFVYPLGFLSIGLGFWFLGTQQGGMIPALWMFLALADFGVWMLSLFFIIDTDRKLDGDSAIARVCRYSVYLGIVLILSSTSLLSMGS